jgi:predicted CoA-substrate-specific enzyme activase
MPLFGGIDVGHQSIKVILVDDESKIRGKNSLVTGDDAETASEKALETALQKAGYKRDELSYLIATGIGKDWVKFANKHASDVRCHSLGAYFLHPSVRTVVNLGAETYRAMKLDENGLVREFVENDKCAAGSGIFLDEMSAALEVTPEEAGRMCLNAKRREKISSLCVVFGESEVVSAVHRGVPKEEILAGIHESIAERAAMLGIRLRPNPDVALTGGPANNPCIVKIMEEKLGLRVIVPQEPHLAGALGAALLARRFFQNQ